MSQIAAASLTVKNIELSFGNNKVLKDISLEIKPGTTTAIIGPSGSGKSTLLRAMNRLIEPDNGQIFINDEDALKINPNILRQRIGMVFQNFNLFPHKSALKNITLALEKIKKEPKDKATEIALKQLSHVGLANKMNHRPSQLSGGQQQRVAIARALAMQPEIMFFDEATSALDPELVKGILKLIKELSDEGMTIIMVTHEMNFAKSVADQVIFMDHGLILESGSPEEIFTNPKHPRLQNFLSEIL